MLIDQTLFFMNATEATAQNHIPLILVTDDDRATRTLLKVAMEEEGYRVITARDGQECLSEYHRCEPDMVLLDAVMPGMDGFTCCRRLHELGGMNFMPVLMITALDDQDSIDQAFAAGAVDYVTKPIHWAVLSQRVRRLLTNSKTLLELEHLQIQLKQQQQWMKLLGILTKTISQEIVSPSFLAEILTEIRSSTESDRVILVEQKKQLRLESITPGFPPTDSLSVETLALESVYQSQYQRGKIITISNLATADIPAPVIAPFLDRQTQSILIAPITYSDQVSGFLSLHHCQNPHLWQSWQIEQLSYLVNLLALVLNKIAQS